MKCKCIKKVQLVTDPNCTFLLSLVAVLLVADAAGVRQVADIGADAYDAADGFYGEHEAGFCVNMQHISLLNLQLVLERVYIQFYHLEVIMI